MVMSQGGFGHPNKAFHAISTDDSFFEEMGLTSFTIDQLYDAIERDGMLTVNSNGSPAPTRDIVGAILSDGGAFPTSNDKPAILYYDHQYRKRHFHRPLAGTNYVTEFTNSVNAPSHIEQVINFHNIATTGNKSTLSMGVQTMLKDIRTSESGCVTWWTEEQPLYVNTTPGASSRRRCVKPIFPKFKLTLYASPKNKRVIAGKGSPVFTAMPTTPHGMSYSFADTDNGAYGSNQFAPPLEGGSDNPKNAVAGELAIFYNRNTGQFESGTKQMLARLLTDVPAVHMNELPDSATIDILDEESNFSPESDFYTGYYNEGWALPMSVHNSNPNQFGPVWKNKDCKKEEKAKVKCINRGPTDFYKSDLVMLSFIDGEWILLEFRKTGHLKPFFGIKNWSFLSYISNSDSYFRDARYYYEAITWNTNQFLSVSAGSQAAGAPVHTSIIQSSDYEGAFHRIYYDDLAKWGASAPGFGPGAGGSSIVDYADLPLWDFKDLGAINLGFKSTLHIPASDFIGGHGPGTAGDVWEGGTEYSTWATGGLIALATIHKVESFERPDIQPADRGYYQYSSFDMLYENMGGLNTNGNLLGRTNRTQLANGDDVGPDRESAYVFYPFSGPIFTDGYKATDGEPGNLVNEMNFLHGRGRYANHFFSNYGAGGSMYWDDCSKDLNQYGGIFSYPEPGGIRTQIKNSPGSAKGLPADVALNSSPSGVNGSPMENIAFLRGCVGSWSAGSLVAGMKRYFYREEVSLVPELATTATANVAVGDETGEWATGVAVAAAPTSGCQLNRYSWIGTPGNSYIDDSYYSSFYDLKPVAPNHVTFMPLTAEVVGSFDISCGPSNVGTDRVLGYNKNRDLYTRAGNNFRVSSSFGGVHIPATLGRASFGVMVLNPAYDPSLPSKIDPNTGSPYPMMIPATGYRDEGWNGYGSLPGLPVIQRGAGRGMLPQQFFDRCREFAPTAGASQTGLTNSQGQSYGPSIPWGSDKDLKIPSKALTTGMAAGSPNWGSAIDGIPYDMYVTNYAKNNYAILSMDWHEGRSGKSAADCVGVTTAKVKIGAGAAGAIVFTCDQLLGISQAGTVTGGQVDFNFIAFFLGLAATGGSSDPTSTATSQWGSLSDNYYDFGTSSLHVRVFEEHPADQTLYDQRYLAVKHFNAGHFTDTIRTITVHSKYAPGAFPGNPNVWPSAPFSEAPTTDNPFDPLIDDYYHVYDKQDLGEDFRVPTYGWVPGTAQRPAGDGQYDNVIVSVGAIIGKNIKLRLQGEWRINPMRRGMLLPFSYTKRSIGLYEKGDSFVFNHVKDSRERIPDPNAPGSTLPNPNYNAMLPHGGEGYKVGDTFVFYGGNGALASAKVEVIAIETNQVTGKAGAVKYPAFNSTTGEGVGLKWVVDGNGQEMRGYGYAGEDFANLALPPDKDHGTVKIMGDEVHGKDFLLFVRAGVVWEVLQTDLAPKEIAGVQRATLSSNNGKGSGKGVAMGTSACSFPIEGARQTYDAFLHFHNDIGHTVGHPTDLGRVSPWQQYVSLNITAE